MKGCDPGRLIIASALIGLGAGMIIGRLLNGSIIFFGVLFAGFGLWLAISK